MGRMAIIVVLTLLFSLAIVGYNMNRRANAAVDNYVGYYCSTRAHDIASSGVEIYIRKLAENPDLPAGTYVISSIMGGVDTVTLASLPGDSLSMTSVGSYNGFSFSVQNKLYPVVANPPTIYGAATLQATQSSALYLNGNTEISGVDTSPPDWPSPSSPGELAGVSYNILPSTTFPGAPSIVGNPPTEQVPSLPDYASWANQMIRLANNVYNNANFSSANFGTYQNPQITYINGNTQISGTVTGVGILIVNGSLTVTGAVNFYGLVVVADSASVETSTSLKGTVQIYGGIVVAGKNVSYSEKGTVNVYYSSEAIANIRNNMKPLKYLIADWWE